MSRFTPRFDEVADAYFRKLAAASDPKQQREYQTLDDHSKLNTIEDRLLNLEQFQREVWSVLEGLREHVNLTASSAILPPSLVATPRLQGTNQNLMNEEFQNDFQELQREVERYAQRTEDLQTAMTKCEQELDRRMEEFQEPPDSLRQIGGEIEKGVGQHFEKQLEEEDENLYRLEYKLASSTWESVCLSFAHTVDLASSVQAALMVCLTAAIQLFFVGICYFTLTAPTFTTEMEEAYKEFRLIILHNDRYTDKINHKSLAQRLCDRSMSLELANSQAATLSDIDGYLGVGETGFEVLFAGPLMCGLSLGCWALTVFTEVRQIMNLVESLLRLPLEHETRIVHSRGRYRFASISRLRRGCMIAISFIRFSICIALLFEGGVFLAVESNVPNLLLNTVALEFVLHIDQLVFECFARDANMRVLDNLAPLKLQVPRKICCLDPKTTVYMLLTTTYIASFFFIIVHPLVDSMKLIEKALCSQNLAFSFVEDTFGFIYLQNMEPVNNFALKTIPRQTIRSAIDLSAPELSEPSSLNFAQNPTIVGYSLDEVVTMGMGRLVNTYNSNCEDLLPSKPGSMFDYSAYAYLYFDRNPLGGCPDLVSFCYKDDPAGVVARWLCPVTCTCNIPNSTTRSMYARGGCPGACHGTPTYRKALETAPCYDRTLTQLGSDAFWQSAIGYLLAGKGTAHIGTKLQAHGCHALSPQFPDLSKQQKEEMCSATGSEATAVRPLAFTCPVHCGCNGTVDFTAAQTKLRSCPATCHFRVYVKGHTMDY